MGVDGFSRLSNSTRRKPGDALHPTEYRNAAGKLGFQPSANFASVNLLAYFYFLSFVIVKFRSFANNMSSRCSQADAISEG